MEKTFEFSFADCADPSGMALIFLSEAVKLDIKDQRGRVIGLVARIPVDDHTTVLVAADAPGLGEDEIETLLEPHLQRVKKDVIESLPRKQEGTKMMREGRKPSHHQLLFASDDMELAIELLKWCRRNGKSLCPVGPGPSALIAVPCFAIVVDRTYIGRDEWQAYCEFCQEVAEPVHAHGAENVPANSGQPPAEREETPVIILKAPSLRTRDRWPVPPSKGDLINTIDRSDATGILAVLEGLVRKP